VVQRVRAGRREMRREWKCMLVVFDLVLEIDGQRLSLYLYI
jgi:hypothetical protein